MTFLKEFAKKVNKELKDDVAYVLDPEEEIATDVKIFIPTGCFTLDCVCTNSFPGGIPVGKITEITAQEGVGKSLLCMHIMSNAQKMGGLCVYIDTERGLNPDFAERIGLDIQNNFIHLTPNTTEEVFDCIRLLSEDLQKEEKEAEQEKRKPLFNFVCIVWDSIAATQTKFDVDNENPDPSSSIGVKARVLSKNIPNLLKLGYKKNMAFVFVNQLRRDINARMPGQEQWVAPGGKAVPYYASLRIRLSNVGKMKSGEVVVGTFARAQIRKTRFGPNHREADFPIYYTHGIDNEESIVEALTKFDLIEKYNAGRNGTQVYFKSDGKESSLSKSDFKEKLYNDLAFKQRAVELLQTHMVIELNDPRKQELEIVPSQGDD